MNTSLATLVAAGVAFGTMFTPLASAEPGSHSTRSTAPKPTVVLVHGAFADASSWKGVVKRLQADGYPVKAPAVPLRDLAGDAAYISSVLAGTEGPIILVGHSYGGAVITNAAAGDPDVKALVYVAAFVPDAGESPAELSARKVEHPIDPLPVQPAPFPAADGSTGVDLYLDPAKYRSTFLSDTVSPATAAVLAASQRPVTAAALNGETKDPAWKKLPSWYLVARQDNSIGADLERFMAERAGSRTEEVNASHDVMLNAPGTVTRLIEKADKGTR
ncbi:lipase family alpha/beta hydrolase [Streptomyces sp. NPDC059894]|uniref:lipase family alpha/beta hydrolase n=1 Tax=unclassified Streptomyces TaxID=2593676 RepID=UPI00364E7675